SGNLHYAGSTTDSYSQGTALSDAQIQTVVSSAISSGRLPKDTNGGYFVLTSADVNATSGFCTQYCGWHDDGTIAGSNIKYAFVGNPDRCPSSCAEQTTSPNGNAGADGMAHHLARARRGDDRSGLERLVRPAWTGERGQVRMDIRHRVDRGERIEIQRDARRAAVP